MANGSGLVGGAAGQEFCLKWNNHRTTIISVMDTLLEEESLVDVTLSADGQFIRAHRVILSACSPYFRQLFKSSFLNDKHPIIIMKDVDFENLKSLVEYMYKGEANVPQHMLPSFIQTAESLQIRGLAEGASKQKLEQVAELNTTNPHLSVPSIPVTPQTNITSLPNKGDYKKPTMSTPDSILAARLKTMVENPPMHMLDFHEQLALAARQSSQNLVPPPMKENKKRRKMDQPQPNTSSPVKSDSNGHKEISVKKDLMSRNARLSPKISQNIMAPSVSSMVSNLSLTNNNDESDSDVLKIDEDGDRPEKSDKDDDIAEVDNGYGGMDDSEEEITMDNEKRAGSGVGFINPWTGEEMPGLPHVSHDVDHDEDSLQDGVGLVGWPLSGGDYDQYGEESHPPVTPPPGHASPTNRLKRLTNTDSVYTMCQTPEGPKFQCAMCARIFNLKCTLLRHVRHQHQGRFVPHPCKTCGQVFKRTDHLKVHMKKIHNMSVKNSLPQTSVQAITMVPSPPNVTLP